MNHPQRFQGKYEIPPFDQYSYETALYGDYFYLEALLRYVKPDWKMYW